MKRKKKWVPVIIALPLLVTQYSPDSVYGMRTAEEFDQSLLMNIDFNQNTFKDDVTSHTFTPSGGTGEFDDGVRYNAYRMQSDTFAIPLSDLNGSSENVLTTSLWFYPDSITGAQTVFTIGSHTLRYNGNSKQWQIMSGGTVVAEVDYNLSSNKWTHVSLQLNKGSSMPLLWVNGNSLSLSQVSAIPPSWNSSSSLSISGHSISTGSRIDEIQLRKGGIPHDLISEIPNLSYIPDLNGEVIGRNPHLSWSSDILPENVLVETSLEDGQMLPRMTWGWDKTTLGGQSIESSGAYSGEKTMKIVDTINNGNHYGFPSTSSTRSISMWNRMHFPNGTNLSVTYYAKTDGATASIAQNGDGGWAKSFSTKQIVTLTKPVKKGERVLTVDSIGSYGIGQHLTFDEEPESIGSQYVVESVNASENTITLRTAVNSDYSAGKEIRNRPWRGAFSFGTRTVPSDGKWHRLSQNTRVYDYADYDVLERGASFYTNFTTPGTVYFDNVKLGYATKSKLYRDGTLLYEGFLSDYRDTASKDIESPGIIQDERVIRTQDKIEVSFSPAIDKGTTYQYRIQAVTNDGDTTPLSKEVPVEVTSGIKGYSYIVNESPLSTPSTTVNSTGTTISTAVSDSRDRYLHIRAIDNEGNAGETKHIKIPRPQLSVSPDESGTFAILDWSMTLDNEPYQYKAYKRKKGEMAFQSISTFEQESGKELKVLNLYPARSYNTANGTYGSIPVDTFRTWKGEVKTLPRSAGLEKWMEEPNAEHPKGFGKGLIDVDAVSYDAFNNNPSSYLQKVNGEWSYDAVFFGSWDANAYNHEFSPSAFQYVKSFVDDGQGLLLGHDVLRASVHIGGFKQLEELVNVDIDGKYGATPASGTWNTNGKTVRLKKTGLMTKYPWNIGEIGSNLSIPATHSLTQLSYGDIWLDFPSEKSVTDANGNGEANFYLTTWNNTGMIQTGHSNGQATPDEQKILANTLFYLSQKTTATSLNDYSSVDDEKPEQIGEVTMNLASRSVFEANFSPIKDKGAVYEYYVEAIGSHSQSRYESPVVEATIQSGLKGYAVEVSTSSTPGTVLPDMVQTTLPLSFETPYRDAFYVHLKSVDKVGNQSVKTLRYDSRVAQLIVEPVTNKWTNGQLELRIRSNQALGKVVNIRLPDGQIVPGDMASYVVQENGLYLFYGQDVFGQWVVGSYLVNQIDKSNPVVDVYGISSEWVNRDTTVQLEAK